MRSTEWKRWLSVFMAAALLFVSVPELVVNASGDGDDQMAEDMMPGGGNHATVDGEDCYQYVEFPNYEDDIIITVPEAVNVTPMEGIAPTTVYRINVTATETMAFEASVRAGDELAVPEELRNFVTENGVTVTEEGRQVYSYTLHAAELLTSDAEPLCIRLQLLHKRVAVQINGNAKVSGVDEYGMAKLGEKVSVTIIDPGYTLAKLTKDEKGNDVYSAMELDYDNCYEFTVEEENVFYVVDPEQVDYTIINSAANKAKLTGVEGIKLVSLGSSAQGYDEIVLNFTAVKNGSDGTETEDVYYEVKANAVQTAGETLPKGSSVTPKYYYIPKTENCNTQSKSIKVNDGDLSASTAATYEFSVRMVYIKKGTNVPDEDTGLTAPLTVSMSNNTITKQFSTKNPYFEDKLSFTKKNTTIYRGQQDLLVGSVKYSANASYLHDLTAVVYDSRGQVAYGFDCVFKNDNDELYISEEYGGQPGKYTVVIYASVGETELDGPQSGTMYQATTSFVLTLKDSIDYIDTGNVIKEIGVNNKNVSFSATPVGYGYYYNTKPKQKFTYEIKSVEFDENGRYVYVDPTEKVKNSVTVNSKGKVTIDKSYYVDENVRKNYIAIAIRAADYEGNSTMGYAVVQITAITSVPTTIYLTNSNGYRYGTTLTAVDANGAYVVVLDQNGKNITGQVKLTPTDNKKGTAAAYVTQSSYNDSAWLYVRKCTNVTIKAVTKDGSKKSTSLKLKITKPKVTAACYSMHSISYKGLSMYDYDTSTGLVTYNAPKGSVIKFRQGAEFNSYGYYNRNWFNWGYKVTGGKLKFDGDYWLITPNKQTAVLTVWDKANPKRTWTLRFVNYDWSTSYEKAPKLKLIDGKLYNNKYSNESDMIYYEEWDYYEITDQELTYQYEFGSYDEVRVARASSNAPYLYVSKFDAQNRTIKFAASPGNDLKTGSFKYTVSFYRNGDLMCMPTTITVKFNKASKVKVTSSYTLDTAYGNGVNLKCSTKDFYPDFENKVLNANVSGKANDFNKYFEVVYKKDAATGINTPMIQFKSSVTAAEKEKLKGTTQTGYVKYSYYYGYSYITNQTAKVSIKIK